MAPSYDNLPEDDGFEGREEDGEEEEEEEEEIAFSGLAPAHLLLSSSRGLPTYKIYTNNTMSALKKASTLSSSWMAFQSCPKTANQNSSSSSCAN